MRITIFGLTVSSSWGNGHATLWRGLIRALADRGHEVAFFEQDASYYAQNRDLREPDGWELVLFSDWHEVRARAAAAVAGSDVAIVTSYCPVALTATELVLDAPRALREPEPAAAEPRRAAQHALEELAVRHRARRAPHVVRVLQAEYVLRVEVRGELDEVRQRLDRARLARARRGRAEVDDGPAEGDLRGLAVLRGHGSGG